QVDLEVPLDGGTFQKAPGRNDVLRLHLPRRFRLAAVIGSRVLQGRVEPEQPLVRVNLRHEIGTLHAVPRFHHAPPFALNCPSRTAHAHSYRFSIGAPLNHAAKSRPLPPCSLTCLHTASPSAPCRLPHALNQSSVMLAGMPSPSTGGSASTPAAS